MKSGRLKWTALLAVMGCVCLLAIFQAVQSPVASHNRDEHPNLGRLGTGVTEVAARSLTRRDEPSVPVPAPRTERPDPRESSPEFNDYPISVRIDKLDPSVFAAEENERIEAVRKHFTEIISRSPNPDPESLEYKRHWIRAMALNDDMLRVHLGADGFIRASALAGQLDELQSRTKQ